MSPRVSWVTTSSQSLNVPTGRKGLVMEITNPKNHISPVKRTRVAWKYLSISRSAFLKMVALGYIPKGIKLTPNSRAVYWRTANLDAYLASRGVYVSTIHHEHKFTKNQNHSTDDFT